MQISSLSVLYYPVYLLFDLRESMPPNWQEFSQENLRHCNQERETSMRLRGVIGQTLSQTSQDMREQADRCEEALSRRVSETEEATRGLEDQLKQVCVSDKKYPHMSIAMDIYIFNHY